MQPADIKAIREKLGLSQREIAERIGATKTSWYKWEKGRSKPHPLFVALIEKLIKKAI
jgi:DNA-binding transcriptional regulator YiaG